MRLDSEVQFWVSRFRCLVGWAVRVDETARYKDQVAVSVESKQATVYGRQGADPRKYALHEVLHIAVRAAASVGRDGEETLVADICEIVMGDQEECGLCGLPGADKVSKWVGGGHYWPSEAVPVSNVVHSECEERECEGAFLLDGVEHDGAPGNEARGG